MSRLIGIGNDYNWPFLDANKLASEMVKYRNTVTSIELSLWGQWSVFKWGVAALSPYFKKFVKAIRAKNLTLLVSCTNDNQGQGKYGDTLKPLSAYPKIVDGLMNLVLSVGPSNLIVQPVSEGQTSYGMQVEKAWICKFSAAGFVTCCNTGARPGKRLYGADRFADHPTSTKSAIPSGAFCVTDTGTILKELQNGGINGSSVNAKAAGSYSKKVKGDLIIYTFTSVKTIQSEAMKAVGGA
ncbi:MAG: hypothetical protein WC455_20300 [Dehalococcoidia bacterium]|jgi:hypothetical protein